MLKFGLLEIAGYPEALSLDHCKIGLASARVVSRPQLKVRDIAIDGRAYGRACKIELRLIPGCARFLPGSCFCRAGCSKMSGCGGRAAVWPVRSGCLAGKHFLL